MKTASKVAIMLTPTLLLIACGIGNMFAALLVLALAGMGWLGIRDCGDGQ